MTRKSLSNTIYLECLAFTIAALLATSDVEATDGGTTRVARAAFNSSSVCYNSKQQKVKCSKKKGIIIGIVVATLFVLLGALYLYGKWAERRKKSKKSLPTEESQPLSNESGTVPDCEKGIPRTSRDDREDPDKFEGRSLSDTSSIASGSSNHYRPPGL